MSIRKATSSISLLCVISIFLTACAKDPMEEKAALYQQALPEALTVVETSSRLLAGDCLHGGMRVTHGLDHNRDGRLNPYERLGSELICNPGATPLDPNRGVAAATLIHPTPATSTFLHQQENH